MGKLVKHTGHKMKYRHWLKGKHLIIKAGVSIYERSKEVDGKRYGDFEINLIVDPNLYMVYTHSMGEVHLYAAYAEVII